MTQDMKLYLFTLVLTLTGLIFILFIGLLPALLAGLLTFLLIDFGAHRLSRIGVIPATGKIILLALIAAVMIGVFTLVIILLASEFTNGSESFVALLQRMADVVDTGRNYLPVWMGRYLPTNIEEWQVAVSEWLRGNASTLSLLGKEFGLTLIHIIFGMILGGLIAITPDFTGKRGPFGQALHERVLLLDNAFRRIVFSQIRISAVNTFFTALFLGILLPLLGIYLPLVKTMIAVTFIVGLLPIIGNLISNTVIVIISLSISPVAAVVSLVFLVVLHKFEYFMNAHIIGTQIKAHAWEILLAMLVMESAFGITGLVSAPIYYAYLKDELSEKKLI